MSINIFKVWSRFWRLRAAKGISPYAGDLFSALVAHCNSIGRKNPFPIDNAKLVAMTGMSLSSMKNARTQLHELGAIGYVPGQKNKADPWYRLYESDADFKDDPRWRGQYKMAQDWATKTHFLWPITEEDKSKSLASTEAIFGKAAGAKEKISGQAEAPPNPGPRFAPEEEKSCAKKEEEPRLEPDAEYHKVPYWRALRTVWFEFNQEHFKIRPSFRGRDHKAFREILLQLEREHFRENIAWTEGVAKKALQDFLKSAIQDEYFLQKKFLLVNLLAQYDAIKANMRTGAFTKTKQAQRTPPKPPARTIARPRAATAQYCGPLQIIPGQEPSATQAEAKRELSKDEWQEMIEQDYKLLINARKDLIFLCGSKYLFLRRQGLLQFKSREHWQQNYLYAVEQKKPETTREAIAAMRRLVYLAFLRKAAEQGKTSIFSPPTNTNGKPGSAGKTRGADGQSAVQGVC